MAHWLEKTLTLLLAPTSDLRELARIAGADPKTFYRGIRLADLDVYGQDVTGMEFAEGLIEEDDRKRDHFKLVVDENNNKISAIEAANNTQKNFKRQEERMAILLDLILRNPDDALLLINLYSQDKAKYANRVLKEIEREIRAKEKTLFEDEKGRRLNAVQLARIVNRPFSRGMPNNRGALLFYMAKHLAKYPDINQYLRQKLKNSWSVFIAPNREQIQYFLDKGERESVGDTPIRQETNSI